MEYSFEFFALVLFVVVLAGILWIFEKTSEAGRNIMATLDSVKSDEQQVSEDVAYRNRVIYEADQYNEAASMEPLCGDGKKKRDRKQESGASDHNLYSKIPYEAITPWDIDLSRPSSHGSYLGNGGSFDGGGASGDWGCSGSGSSSISDCSSSSSDSGSSSCSSSD